MGGSALEAEPATCSRSPGLLDPVEPASASPPNSASTGASSQVSDPRRAPRRPSRNLCTRSATLPGGWSPLEWSRRSSRPPCRPLERLTSGASPQARCSAAARRLHLQEPAALGDAGVDGFVADHVPGIQAGPLPASWPPWRSWRGTVARSSGTLWSFAASIIARRFASYASSISFSCSASGWKKVGAAPFFVGRRRLVRRR